MEILLIEEVEANSVVMHNVCPKCGHQHDRAMGISGAEKPENGHVSFCAVCGFFALFDDKAEGGLRKLTPEEWKEFCAEVDVPKILMTWEVAKALALAMMPVQGGRQ